jgi:signal peptidase I
VNEPDPNAGLSTPPRVLLPVEDPHIAIPGSRPNNKSLGRELFETVLIAVLLFVAVQSMVQNRWVDGRSMEPTLHPEERLIIDRFSYLRWDDTVLAGLVQTPTGAARPQYVLGAGPQRGDIIVLHPPTGDTTDYIKRIIAFPGETVQIKQNDGVYINGVRLKEPYIKEKPDYNYGPYQVPSQHVFVLGDNRNDSSDSHLWGPLKMSDIVGKAWISYWPRELLGLIPHPSYAEMEQP